MGLADGTGAEGFAGAVAVANNQPPLARTVIRTLAA
jgi:hypothetical protein